MGIWQKQLDGYARRWDTRIKVNPTQVHKQMNQPVLISEFHKGIAVEDERVGAEVFQHVAALLLPHRLPPALLSHLSPAGRGLASSQASMGITVIVGLDDMLIFMLMNDFSVEICL